MAAYRKISVTFWADSFIQSLTPEGKYFYLYLMTNTRTTQCGIYEITLNQMCFETGYNVETVNKLIDQFEKTGRVKYSKKTNEIALKNWPKYNDSESPKVRACVENELKLVKNRVLIQYLYSIDTSPQEAKAKEETKTKSEEEAKEQTQEVLAWPTFEDFWDAYNKKIDRPKCEKKWNKITQGAREKIMFHVTEYVKTTPDIQYRKNPSTYLNNESWENEIITITNGNNKNINHVASLAEDFARRHGSKVG
jgi:hypothetical protein